MHHYSNSYRKLFILWRFSLFFLIIKYNIYSVSYTKHWILQAIIYPTNTKDTNFFVSPASTVFHTFWYAVPLMLFISKYILISFKIYFLIHLLVVSSLISTLFMNFPIFFLISHHCNQRTQFV